MNQIYNKQYFIRSFGKGILDANRVKVERARLVRLKEFLRPHNEIKILDLGCGYGYFLNICDREGWRTYGADISNYALVQAKNNTKAELFCVNINEGKLPFYDDFFDAIVSFDVAEHLQSDKNYFQEIKRTLKDGGLVIISTPDGKSPHDTESTHINLLTQQALLEKLKENGFNILTFKENRGYVKRLVPLRRFPIVNWFNQRLCDLAGWYVKEVVVIAQKKSELLARTDINMDLSIIIVSWNVKEKLKDNLRAIYESQNASFEVFVVDNNSTDGSAEMVKKEYPQVKLIVNQENFGFARANNQGIRQASGRYILLLNPDMRVFDDTLSNMVSWLNLHKQVWVAGCRLVDESAGTIKQVRRYPALLDQLIIVLKIPHLFPAVLNKYLRNDFYYSKSGPVDSIRGSFFMIRKEAIRQIGSLDERYFLWFEEVDYCRRVRQAGGEVWYSSAAQCLDLTGQSFQQLGLPVKQRYFRDSMLKYFKKWHSPLDYWLLRLVWPVGLFFAWIGEKIKIKSQAKT